MVSLATAWKKAYSEALAPYGFTKLKGRHPYFVRMVGDEILQVIAYHNEWSMRPERAFQVLAGMATVYRREIDLHQSPKDNNRWLEEFYSMYYSGHYYEEEAPDAPDTFYKYIDENEDSMNDTIARSIYHAKKYILPVLDGVTDINTYIEYLKQYHQIQLKIHVEEFSDNILQVEENESLLALKTFHTLEEFIKFSNEIYEQNMKKRQNQVDIGFYSKEHFDKETKWSFEYRQEQIEAFAQLLNDPVIHEKAMEELERRKNYNIEALHEYGLKF